MGMLKYNPFIGLLSSLELKLVYKKAVLLIEKLRNLNTKHEDQE